MGYLVNEGFTTNLTGWTAVSVAWDAAGYSGGCAKWTASGGTLYQQVVLPDLGLTTVELELEILTKCTDDDDSNWLLVKIVNDAWQDIEKVYRYCPFHSPYPNEWRVLTFRFEVANAATIIVYFQGEQAVGDTWYLDSVDLHRLPTMEAVEEGSCEELTLELMKRRRDLGAVKHPEERYHEILNRAILECPAELWRLDVDTSLTTVEETRRYSLGAITEIEKRGQVKRVWMEDQNENELELARWRVEDDLGTLTLVLDEDPPEADRTITLEYTRPHEALDCEDAEDVTTADREWVLAKAMVGLLLEADPEHEDPAYLAAEIQRWDLVRQGRERELTGRVRRKAGRARSRKW